MNTKDKIFFESEKVSKKEQRLLARERLVYNATEDILVIMESKGISKAELSKKIGKSRSYVSQILSGARNMTLGTLSDLCFAIDTQPKISFPMPKMTVELTEQTVKQSHIWSKETKPQLHLVKKPVAKKETVLDVNIRLWQDSPQKAVVYG